MRTRFIDVGLSFPGPFKFRGCDLKTSCKILYNIWRLVYQLPPNSPLLLILNEADLDETGSSQDDTEGNIRRSVLRAYGCDNRICLKLLVTSAGISQYFPGHILNMCEVVAIDDSSSGKHQLRGSEPRHAQSSNTV